MKRSSLVRCGALLAVCTMVLPAAAARPDELLAAYVAQAGKPASPARGQRLFNDAPPGGAFGWSCATCPGSTPSEAGRQAISKKRIDPLAPAFNARRFTDRAQVEFHFKLNCKDVLGRECSAAEKADVLSWLLSFKR